MLRKVIGAVVVLVLFVGVTFAEQIRAIITKVDSDKVTFAPLEGKGKKATKGPEKTLPVANDVKVVRMKRNKETKKLEVGKDVKNGLQNKMFSNIPEKGIQAILITDAGNKKVTEIQVLGGGGKNKNK